jgi:putative glycosyl hydrolase-like family 15 (GHL15) protein
MSRRRSLIVAVSISLPTTLGLLAVSGDVAGAAAFPSAHRIRNWEPEFMSSGHTYTKTQALAQAKEFDVIVGDSWAFRSYVSAMKGVNPSLRLLAYQNGGYSIRDSGSKYPDAWYAHTTSGAKIKSVDFGNYLMDVSNSHWIDAVGDLCLQHLRDSHYDGCFLDSLGPAALQAGYATGQPMNPATGKVWTRGAYIRATANLAAKVERRVARSKFVVANGVQNGREYFEGDGPTGQLADPIDGAMVELFVRPPFTSATTYRSVNEWRMDVDMLVDAGKKGRTLFCVTKSWGSATDAQEDQLFRYSLGTFLLGTNGRSYFSFLYDRNTARTSTWWDAKLGRPTSHYHSHNGVFRRSFENGKVLVNPSDSSRAVKLRRAYLTLTGTRVRSVSLAPHTAAILVRP